MSKKNKNATRLPGEFELKTINCGDPVVRGSLNHYYATGGNIDGNGTFQGKILKQDKGWTLLKNITVRFTDMDINYVFYDVVGTEDHVWIHDEEINQNYKAGDNIQFTAKVYAYRRNPDKHGGHESMDFSLKELENIKRIDDYDFPPKDMEENQNMWHQKFIEELVCETCLYSGQCYHTGICLAPDGYRDDMIRSLTDLDNALKGETTYA